MVTDWVRNNSSLRYYCSKCGSRLQICINHECGGFIGVCLQYPYAHTEPINLSKEEIDLWNKEALYM